jgi:hypothetical protein
MGGYFCFPRALGKILTKPRRRERSRPDINRLELGGQPLAVLPADVFQRITNQMNDAGLNLGEGKDRGDRLGKVLEPISHRNQNIAHSSVFDLGHHAQPELGSLALLDPDPQNLFGPVGKNLRPATQPSAATFCAAPITPAVITSVVMLIRFHLSNYRSDTERKGRFTVG